MNLSSEDLVAVAKLIRQINSVCNETKLDIMESYIYSDGEVLGRIVCPNGEYQFAPLD